MSQEGDVENEIPLCEGQDNSDYDASSTNEKGS